MNTPTTAERIARKLYDSGYVGGPMSSHQQNIEQLVAMIQAELERERQQVRRVLEQALDGNYWHGGGCAGADGVSRCNCWVADAHALLALLAEPQAGKEG